VSVVTNAVAASGQRNFGTADANFLADHLDDSALVTRAGFRPLRRERM